MGVYERTTPLIENRDDFTHNRESDSRRRADENMSSDDGISPVSTQDSRP